MMTSEWSINALRNRSKWLNECELDAIDFNYLHIQTWETVFFYSDIYFINYCVSPHLHCLRIIYLSLSSFLVCLFNCTEARMMASLVTSSLSRNQRPQIWNGCCLLSQSSRHNKYVHPEHIHIWQSMCALIEPETSTFRNHGYPLESDHNILVSNIFNNDDKIDKYTAVS